MFKEDIQEITNNNQPKYTRAILDTFSDPADAVSTYRFLREEQVLLMASHLSDWDRKKYRVCHLFSEFAPVFYYKKRYFSVTGNPFTDMNWKVTVDHSPECEFLPDDWGIDELIDAADRLAHRKKGPRKPPQLD